MNRLDDTVAWAAVLILAVPVVVLLFGEVAERLRQRSSSLAVAVAIVRNWVLPVGVAYLVVRALLSVDADSPGSRLLATGVVVSLAVLAIVVLRLLTRWLNRRADDELRPRPPQLLLALPKVLVVFVTLWVLFSAVWGVSLSGAFAALGVTSIVVSLALQSTLSGLASGLLLLADQPFRPGEWIEVDDVEGQVVDVNYRATRIRDRNGDLVVIPNSQLATATLVNHDQPTRVHRVTMRVQVAFANAPNRAIEMLLAAARGTPGVLTDPAPDVKVVKVDDPLMEYEIQVWIDDHAITPRVKSNLGALVWYASERLGVPLPSPAQDLYLWDGPTVAADRTLDADALAGRLGRAPLLAGLTGDELTELAAAARREVFGAGETIVSIDAGEDDLRVLTTGHAVMVVDLPSGPATVAELSPGDVFGLVRRDHVDARDPRIVATEDCDVVAVAGATATVAIGRNPGVAGALTRVATGRHRRIQRLVDEGGTVSR